MNSTACATRSESHRTNRIQYTAPRASLRANEDGYLLSLDLPGVPKDGLEVHVEDRELTVTGRRQAPTPQSGENPSVEVLYTERNAADYRRTFELDPQIDASRIEARLENGVLTLRLPKSEAVKPRKIQISA